MKDKVTDADVERVARAMMAVSRPNAYPDDLTPAPRGSMGLVPKWHLFAHLAEAAIAAMQHNQNATDAALTPQPIDPIVERARWIVAEILTEKNLTRITGDVEAGKSDHIPIMLATIAALHANLADLVKPLTGEEVAIITGASAAKETVKSFATFGLSIIRTPKAGQT